MLFSAMPQPTLSNYLSMNIHEHYIWTSSPKYVLLIILIAIAMQCNAMQRNTTERNATQRNETQRNSMQYKAIQHNVMPCHIQCNAKELHAAHRTATIYLSINTIYEHLLQNTYF